ncbi:hypothetical protein GSI_03764 [Ganoderma sinense ZZ0214-1]|uniref:Uncharacterized protein n=1 Tax=Ganoderma sinense ZZ0214-1 TaxID=1077348 RepID=A0A2G8SJV9_9APHY|nr:hypothetical protein GSI_03764 [Ganoderma sinense ZZ0214-1]
MEKIGITLPETAYDRNPNPLPAKSCPKFPLQGLPSQSVVFDGNDRTRFWTVMGVDGIMVPAPNSGLSVRSGEFPNGTTARVPTTVLVSATSLVDYVKMDDGWKRIPSGGVNVQVTDQVIVGQPGTGEFWKVEQPADFHGGGQIDPLQQLDPVELRIPPALAEDGQFEGSDMPAFGDNGNVTRKLNIAVQVNVSTGVTVTYRSSQYTIWRNGKSITRGVLAIHATAALVGLMGQERERGSALCINGLEIHPDDLLLVELKQISQGTLQAEIAVRIFS